MADAEPDEPTAPETAQAADGSSEDRSTEDPSPDAVPPPDEAAPNEAAPDEAAPLKAVPGETAPGEAVAPAPEGSTSDGPGGTVPPWWVWVGRHRKPVVLVAVLAVVAAVAAYVVVSASASSPRDVVRSYMDALRAGDTEAALEIVGEPEDDGRVRFLSADALADDWSVESVVERHVHEDEADVDVTIRAGGAARQGRFHVVRGEDGWAIESPFVHVDLTVGDLDVVELGGVRQPAVRDETTREARLLVFPGVYDLYPSLADRLAFDQPRFIAAPTESDDLALGITVGYTLTGAGAEDAQEAVDAAVDTCAAQKVPGPPGCPFDVSENPAVYRLDDVSDVAWTVVSHPVAHFAQARNGSGVEMVVRKPGTVRVTGTGVQADAGRTSFALTCEFGLDNLTLAVTADGVTIGNATRDDYSAALSTQCY